MASIFLPMLICCSLKSRLHCPSVTTLDPIALALPLVVSVWMSVGTPDALNALWWLPITLMAVLTCAYFALSASDWVASPVRRWATSKLTLSCSGGMKLPADLLVFLVMNPCRSRRCISFLWHGLNYFHIWSCVAPASMRAACFKLHFVLSSCTGSFLPPTP